MSPLLLLIFVLLLPLLVMLALYGLVSISFVKLGIPRSLTLLLFIAILVGGLINIPVWVVSQEQPGGLFRMGHVFFIRPPRVEATIIAVNVGGALIPCLLSLVLLPRAPLVRTALATAIVAAVAYALSDVVPGRGITLNVLVPPGISAITAMVLAWDRAAPVAYISGVVGTLVGADLLKLGQVLEMGGTLLSIGGAGVFDGIFLVGIIAAFLSPGGRR